MSVRLIPAIAIDAKAKETITHSLKKERDWFVFSGKDFQLSEEMEKAFSEFKKFYTKLPPFLSEMRYYDKNVFQYDRHSDHGTFECIDGEVKIQKDKYASIFNIPDLEENIFLKNLIATTITLLPDYEEKTKDQRSVEVLLTRHTSSVDALHAHKDRAGIWLVQYNIDRSAEGIQGGDIRIYSLSNKIKPIVEAILEKPLDGYILDNRYKLHGANAISIEEGKGAHRDVVIMQISSNMAKW